MKKIVFGLVALFCGTMYVQAQDANQSAAQVSTTEAFDYNRSSLSIITLGSNSSLQAWAEKEDFGGKFDMNKIATNHLYCDNDTNSILEALVSEKVGKQILDYWVGYDGKQFDGQLLRQRSSYNATDADVLRDNAAEVRRLGTASASKGLLANSYILVANLQKVETGKDGDTYTVKVDAHVYRADLNDQVVATTWANWIDEEATDEMKSNYNALNIDIEKIASATGKTGSGSSVEAAITDAFAGVLNTLEKKIDKWQVVTSIYQKHPLGAKIGKKENLKNSDRFRAFKIVEDKDGYLKAKKVGFVRATKVIDNRQNATGESECSHFYQISGRTLREGMYLKQKNDAKISLSAAGVTDGYSPFSIDVDFLAHTSQALGTMQYIGLSVGAYAEDGGDDTWIPVSLNYGIGIHPIRVLEIMPNIGVGADYYNMSEDESEDKKFDKQLLYFARAGIKVGLQICYPLQVFVRADYSYEISRGELYYDADEERFGKLSFGAGLRINF